MLACMAFFAGATQSHAQLSISRLRTEYQTEPIGIDVAKPRLSWQLSSTKHGARQTAYRIVSALSKESLEQGQYVYDSGKIVSDKSVSVPFGAEVQAATRYFWKVYTWDEQGKMSESSTTWFETGLMSLGWSGAKWIGSNEVILSKYRKSSVIEYDVRALNGEATFVFGAQGENRYASVTLNTESKELIFKAKMNGELKEFVRHSVAKELGNASTSALHHIKLFLNGSYSVNVEIDGQKVAAPKQKVDNPRAFGRGDGFFIRMISEQNPTTDRLNDIGYDQPAGKKAEFSNIAISETIWGTTFSVISETILAEGFKTWSPVNASAPMLQKNVNLRSNVASARLYVSSRGIHECYVNGMKVNGDYFNSGWPEYTARLYYNTYDVTSLLKKGQNALGAILGAGWWNDNVGMGMDPYGMAQSFMAKLVVKYDNGLQQTFVTDGSWKVCDDGPVINNGMQTGEDYDARKEIPNFSTVKCELATWKPVKIFDAPKSNVIIEAYVGETVKNNITLTAKSMTEPIPGKYIYDLGVNMVGIPRISGLNGKAGQKVTVRYAEMLWPEVIPVEPVPPLTIEDYKARKGQMYTDNYRGALSRDIYYMSGKGNEVFEPSLVQHGFRYLEISGIDEPLPLENVKGLVLESIGEQLSWYETSNPNINQLFKNIIWGQRGNFLAVPTDCPQRDERLGWMGDAQVFSRTATYNMLCDGFYTRWMASVRDDQGEDGSYPDYAPWPMKGGKGMAWMDAGVIIPWQVYQQYGDTQILEDHYESLTRYMDFLDKRANNFIQPTGPYGDWLAPASTSVPFINTCYYGYDAWIMERVATALGKTADAEKYHTLYENIKKAFNEEFVNPEGYTWASGGLLNTFEFGLGSVGISMEDNGSNKKEIMDTQTSYVLPLMYGLFNEENKPKAIQHLADAVINNDYKLNTGFLGTPYICTALSDNGHPELAYKLFEQTEYPSWLFSVLQGATTIWERWNSYTLKNGFGPVVMNSFNHYSTGAIEEWMMSRSIGIERDVENPGYKHILLLPDVGGTLKYIEGGFESMYGKISSGWKKQGKGYTYHVTIPANTTATLKLPVLKNGNVTIKEGAAYVKAAGKENGKNVYELQSGSYSFVIK